MVVHVFKNRNNKKKIQEELHKTIKMPHDIIDIKRQHKETKSLKILEKCSPNSPKKDTNKQKVHSN